MKALLLIPLLLSSCAFGPGIYRGKEGAYYVHTGGAFISARKEVMAKVTTLEGDTIEYMAKGEEADDVALAATAAYGVAASAKEATTTALAKESTTRHAAGQVTAQKAAVEETTRVIAGEETKRLMIQAAQ